MKRSAGRWGSAKPLFIPLRREKKKYGGLGVSELRELRQLKDENARLKQMVADLSLDKQMLQDVIKKKL